jgi:hypothetical protein
MRNITVIAMHRRGIRGKFAEVSKKFTASVFKVGRIIKKVSKSKKELTEFSKGGFN